MANSTPDENSFVVESVHRNKTGLAEMPENNEHCDALYLFGCHLEWCSKQSLVTHQELLVAIDDHDFDIRNLAEQLLSGSGVKPAD